MRKNILVTGYTPFDRFEQNPSYRIAQALDGADLGNGWKITGKSLEVNFKTMPENLYRWWDEYEPSIVLGLGLAYGSSGIRLERFGHNWLEIANPDNGGNTCAGEPLDPNAPSAYQTNLPVKELVNLLLQEGIPAFTSDTAGTHLCNMFLFTALQRANQMPDAQKPLCGFVHLPAEPQLVSQLTFKDKINALTPSMSIELMLEAVKIILRSLVK
jgi:pyroglutamyl-peptidase